MSSLPADEMDYSDGPNSFSSPLSSPPAPLSDDFKLATLTFDTDEDTTAKAEDNGDMDLEPEDGSLYDGIKPEDEESSHAKVVTIDCSYSNHSKLTIHQETPGDPAEPPKAKVLTTEAAAPNKKGTEEKPTPKKRGRVSKNENGDDDESTPKKKGRARKVKVEEDGEPAVKKPRVNASPAAV